MPLLQPGTEVRLIGWIPHVTWGSYGRVVGYCQRGGWSEYAVAFPDGVWGVESVNVLAVRSPTAGFAHGRGLSRAA